MRIRAWGGAAVAALVTGVLLARSRGGGPVPPPPAARASEARLEAHVRALVERHSPRDAGHPDGMAAAARWIAGELRASGARVSEQPFEAGGATYRNVVGALGPDGGERIVVGAHYDTAGPLPGADDNASGVAGLLELARLLGADPPPLRVDLVAFANEEPPWFATEGMGSAVHAASLAAGAVHVRAMLGLEMIGYFSDAPGSQELPLPGMQLLYPTRGNFIAVVGYLGDIGLVRKVKRAMQGASPLPVESINAPASLPGVDLSDHRSYHARGWPAVMITDTAFYRNPNYHRETDLPVTLDHRRMAQVIDGVHAAVRALAR